FAGRARSISRGGPPTCGGQNHKASAEHRATRDTPPTPHPRLSLAGSPAGFPVRYAKPRTRGRHPSCRPLTMSISQIAGKTRQTSHTGPESRTRVNRISAGVVLEAQCRRHTDIVTVNISVI